MAQLNELQQRVVNTLDRNLLVLASAGTGKTNTLAHRVAHIITSGRASAEAILCMTFTNKASREMKDRIATIAGSSAKAVEVSTFHSFCYKVIREESKRNDGLYAESAIYDEEDAKEILLPWKQDGVKDMLFAAAVAHVKEYRSLWNYYGDDEEADLQRTIDRLIKEEEAVMLRFFGGKDSFIAKSGLSDFKKDGARRIAGYNRALADLHGMDFTDLITEVRRLFNDPETASRWQQRYQYICVDEMQDTGELEAAVLKVLWTGNRVLLCGDYFQTIYEWRGSKPLELLDDYKAEFDPETIVFYENYRANRSLFDASLAVLERMFPQLVERFYEEKPYAASKDPGEPILIHPAPTEWKEGAYIFDSIRKLSKDSDVGVLVRNNRQAQYLSQLFNKLNESLPEDDRRAFMIIDQFKFFRRGEIKDVMAYFKLLINPYDAMSAKRIIKRYVSGIGDARIQAIESEESRQAGLRLTDFLDLRIFEAEPYERLVSALKSGNVVVYDVESTGTDTTRDDIIQIAAIRLNADGTEGEVFERFLKPTKSVGTSAAVHGFTDEYLAEHGEDPAVVLKDFIEFSKGAVIVGHNVCYDVSILGAQLHKYNLPAASFSAVYDTLDIYRRFYPRLENHKLGFLSDHFPIDHKPTHNALDDIRATGLLLNYAIEHNIEPTVDKRRALISMYKDAFAPIAAGMDTLRRKSYTEKPSQLLAYIMNQMGVVAYYKEHREEARIENIRDLYRILTELEQRETDLTGRGCLQRILEEAALTAGEPDRRIKNSGVIPIITVHQAKGSEFDHVFLAGMRDGEFPSRLAVMEGNLPEEQRLFYVAITRARKTLCMTYAKEDSRHRQGRPSPFLQYLPAQSVTGAPRPEELL